MLNYQNLSDVEFEYIACDVMSRMLETKLRRFGPGKDGGIDLTNNLRTKEIVVQVKHYIKSSVADLIRALKKEIPKVKRLKPKRYYICCCTELTPEKTTEILMMFSEYMSSEKNIVTVTEIEEFLADQKNKDILRNHFKLWISSINGMDQLFTNDIFIDSETLVYNIKRDEQFFVQTRAYNLVIDILSKSHAIFIIGNPGVGKTITSEMIVLNYIAQGYRVRYTTDGTDLSSLKKALSVDKDLNEIVLLDDCLEQAYFDMKSTQSSELIALIQYINMSENKLIVLNSRVSIYNDAKKKYSQLSKAKEEREFRVYVIDMDQIDILEKAKIFYNHIYFNGMPPEYFRQIKKDKNYLKIITHSNYNPRIIEYMCRRQRYNDIRHTDYLSFIMNKLDNPNSIWEDEYENRLVDIDRILVCTVYSLTTTVVIERMLEACFNHRLKKLRIDNTLNHFKNSLSRLNGSMLLIVDSGNSKYVSVSNPSVNDYIANRLSENQLELSELLDNIISIRQMRRMLGGSEYVRKINEILENKEILNYEYETSIIKAGIVSYYVCEKKDIGHFL